MGFGSCVAQILYLYLTTCGTVLLPTAARFDGATIWPLVKLRSRFRFKLELSGPFRCFECFTALYNYPM
ncbi:hypothetical protein BDV93DRAFT_364057 [Ceratobasidium sp. AG-I]|nr:hypothetical protein BDV93DRAFT_364057 [Ceratobasidium sp. AG-I]